MATIFCQGRNALVGVIDYTENIHVFYKYQEGLIRPATKALSFLFRDAIGIVE